MTQEQFEDLVARLERDQAANPKRYRLRVLLLAAAGYGYIALVLAVAIALLLTPFVVGKFNALMVKGSLVVGAFVFVIARAMWVRLDPPEGREITRREAPELFAMLDALQRELHVSARFDHVLLTEDFNAAVVQVPRLGILGWHRNYLIIGLPLMKALTRKQFAAVLAHELGHLAGGHARLGNWLYRLRLGWARLATMLEQSESAGGFVFRPFFAKYVPYFSAVSFPLARANEYEADANAARLTSPTAAAAALTTVNVMGSFLASRFWPELHQKATTHATPQFAPFSDMGSAMRTKVDVNALRGWLAEAVARKTSVADTHPALNDRLKALGQQPHLALPGPGESADALLGPCLATVTDEFDQRWQRGIAPAWERRHQQAQHDREELAALDVRARSETLTIEQQHRRALLTEDVGAGKEAALEQFRRIQTEHPNDALANYSLGMRLLECDDDAGVTMIERAIEQDSDATAPGAALLRDYHGKHGREAEAARWHRIWSERQEVLYLAEVERSRVAVTDHFESHGLDAAEMERVREQIASVPGVRAAWLVRKRVEHLAEHPLFVLGFKTTPWYWMQSVKKAYAVRDALVEAVGVPGSLLVLCVEEGNAAIRRRMNKVAGARIG